MAPLPAETAGTHLWGELDSLVEIGEGQGSLDFRQRDDGIQPAVALDGEPSSMRTLVSLLKGWELVKAGQDINDPDAK